VSRYRAVASFPRAVSDHQHIAGKSGGSPGDGTVGFAPVPAGAQAFDKLSGEAAPALKIKRLVDRLVNDVQIFASREGLPELSAP